MAQVLYAPNWTVVMIASLAVALCGVALLTVLVWKVYAKRRAPRGFPIAPINRESDNRPS